MEQRARYSKIKIKPNNNEEFKPFFKVNIKSGIIMIDKRSKIWADKFLSGKLPLWGEKQFTVTPK